MDVYYTSWSTLVLVSSFDCQSCRNCRDDQALYSAFNLSNLIPAGNISSQIQTLVNFSQVSQSAWMYLVMGGGGLVSSTIIVALISLYCAF